MSKNESLSNSGSVVAGSDKEGSGTDEAASFDLARHLPYLINRVAVGVSTHLAARMIDGLSLPKWRTLAVLLKEGERSIGDLSERTSIELSTLSRAVSALQRQKLVERQRRGHDRRTVMVTLTQSGKESALRMIDSTMAVEALIADGLTPEQADLLRGLLAQVDRNLQRPLILS
jgi:DNA-binding MarR family transcriptional regulator